MKRLFLWVGALLMLAGCAGGGQASGSALGATSAQSSKPVAEYRKISPQEAEKMMTQDAVVLDVRTAEEYAEGHIPGAVLLPDNEIKDKATQLLPDKNQTILVYCRSGRRSANAAKELADRGYTAVYDFGGIQDWPGDVVQN